MSASAQRKARAPRFSTYVDVEVDIEPEDLERAGWVYVGKGDVVATDTAVDVVREWHNEAHEGPWQWCAEQPCDALRGRPHDGSDR